MREKAKHIERVYGITQLPSITVCMCMCVCMTSSAFHKRAVLRDLSDESYNVQTQDDTYVQVKIILLYASCPPDAFPRHLREDTASRRSGFCQWTLNHYKFNFHLDIIKTHMFNHHFIITRLGGHPPFCQWTVKTSHIHPSSLHHHYRG